ncbi:hypothetical protein BDM02DRAFT_3191015 [Thelephora ganbajun]|uniref:Uncharacterized protein n=1 Tax=Thelephora ganbajun TaxID=370292 RepID=A0ACB6Z386_THEGA|nr:hypothetical protein BDM02DRAFT_3191015 [Thelephora ganbajun]
MSSDNPNPPGLLLEGMGFTAVDTISANDRSLSDILSRILQHEETGIPLVVRGLNADPNWSPLPGPDPPKENRDVEHQPPVDDPERQDTPPSKDAFVWVHRLSLIPKDLLLLGPRETSPVTVERCQHLHNEADNRGGCRPLRQNHCASTFHWLTLDSIDAASDVWFILEASHADQMEARLSTLPAGSRAMFIATSELLSCSFPVFHHVQSAGDLLVIPPRCFAQNLQEGSSTSVSWSRMSIHGLSLALHYELPILCLPEEYGIRKVIYTIMKSHVLRINEFLSGPSPGFSISDLDTCHSIPRVANELQKLIRLFDNVLLEGYSDDHDLLILPDHTEHNPMCHYCGASLFLSYFNCAGVCFDLETDSRADMSTRVCGACYVEGRFCACKNMTPRCLRNFSNVLRERNDTASTLTSYSVSRSVQINNLGEISERNFSWPRIAVFQAAKELWKLGNAPEIDRNFREVEHAHHAKCHTAKCFRHLLGGNIHSSEALLVSMADSDSTIWHQLHLAGQPIGIAEQFAFFALNFSSTSLVNGETSIGFYDRRGLQSLTGFMSTHGEDESGDIFLRARSSASTGSRASSRSTVVPQSEIETSDYPPVTVGHIAHRSTERDDTTVGSSMLGSKRSRNPESQDETEPPPKRTRLHCSSTRTLRATSSQSSITTREVITTTVLHPPPQLQQPDESGTSQSEKTQDQSIKPANRPTASTLNINQTLLQRKQTQTVSSSSLGSKPVSTTSFDQPLAFNFFNPTTDPQRGESSVPPSTNFGVQTEQVSANTGQTTQPLPRSNSLFRHGSFLSAPTLGPPPSPSHFRTHFDTMSIHEHSPFARGVGESTRPAGGSHPLAREDITRALRERQDSHEDLDTQRVLRSMQGDSLSKENLRGYMDLLRESGAFDKSM